MDSPKLITPTAGLKREFYDMARERGLTQVVITCDEDNLASTRIIESNGGQRTGRSVSEESGKSVLRFEILL